MTLAAKAKTRELLRQRERLKNDPRQDINEVVWADEMCRISRELLRIYISHIATEDWIFGQLTGDIPHALMDVEGERAFYSELQAWAKV